MSHGPQFEEYLDIVTLGRAVSRTGRLETNLKIVKQILRSDPFPNQIGPVDGWRWMDDFWSDSYF